MKPITTDGGLQVTGDEDPTGEHAAVAASEQLCTVLRVGLPSLEDGVLQVVGYPGTVVCHADGDPLVVNRCANRHLWGFRVVVLDGVAQEVPEDGFE